MKNKGNNFNPLPRKEGDSGVDAETISKGDFNPLPRKEGDLNQTPLKQFSLISIHSLVKRETSTV